MMLKQRKRARGLILSASSQVASNASNLAFTIIVARTLETEALGVFATLMALFSLGVGGVRAFSSEPLIFDESAVRSWSGPRRHGSALTTALIVSIVIALLIIPICVVVGVSLQTTLLFCCVIPIVLIQDTVRFLLNDLEKQSWAVSIEIVWLVIQLPLMLTWGSDGSLNRLLVCWATGAATSVLVALFALRRNLSFGGGVQWLRSVFTVGRIYLVDFIVSSGTTQLSIFILVIVAGFDAAGELRAAQILLTPLLVFTLGASFALAPETAKMVRDKKFPSLRKLPIVYGSVVVALTAVTILLSLSLPLSFLSFIMGDSAEGGRRVVPYAAAAIGLMGLSVGSGLVLRALGKVRQSVAAKVIITPFTLLFVAVGAHLGAAIGSSVGLCVGNALRVFAASLLVSRSLSARMNYERWLSGGG